MPYRGIFAKFREILSFRAASGAVLKAEKRLAKWRLVSRLSVRNNFVGN